LKLINSQIIEEHGLGFTNRKAMLVHGFSRENQTNQDFADFLAVFATGFLTTFLAAGLTPFLATFLVAGFLLAGGANFLPAS
jgi:hypothetical protein